MSVGGERDYLILTNNPLVRECMSERGSYILRCEPEKGFRDMLIEARDLVYAGHCLYTHPLAGSVKPNETPYKSLIVSQSVHGFDASHAELISNAIAVFDKFPPLNRTYSGSVLRDFQLIDYALLAGAIGFDAAAGLANTRTESKA